MPGVISLFQPGDSFLHRLHPLTKLTFSLAAIAVIFGGPGGWRSALFPGMLGLMTLWAAGLARPALHTFWRILMPLAVVLFLIHGLFNPHNQTSLLALGPLSVGQEGILYAGLVLLRLAAALSVSLQLVLSTHPAHLVQALAQAGLPVGLAYLLGSPLLLLPQIASRVQSVQAAQQSRGLETQGNLLQRARALFPLAAPLVFGALLDVEERALSLEVRGFSASVAKTSLVELQDSFPQRLARWGMALLAVLLILVGVWR